MKIIGIEHNIHENLLCIYMHNISNHLSSLVYDNITLKTRKQNFLVGVMQECTYPPITSTVDITLNDAYEIVKNI